MLFPTLAFAVFFLIVFCGHWLLIRHAVAWKLFILAASWFFYAYWDWRFLGLLILYTVVNYSLALASYQSGTPPRRRWVALAIVFNLSLLGFFKYYGFFTVSAYAVCGWVGLRCPLPLLDVVLPIGISFFTFQAISYVIDVHRGLIEPAHSVIDFAIYKAFFPQLVAGPIIRASHFIPQFYQIMSVRRIDAGRAAALIMGGLFKKVVIANYIAVNVVDPVFGNPWAYQGLDVLLAVYGYAVQIYCDFSAYSDIAIGVAQLLGFHFPENFNAPYFARSVREFWQRWHISLSTWLRDYLFFSLLGTRLGASRYALGLCALLTFLLGGLWHGAAWTFVLWGALQGLYMTTEFLLAKLLVWMRAGRPLPEGPVMRLAQRMAVIHLICISHLFFRAHSITDGVQLLQGIMGSWHGAVLLTFPAVLALIIGFLTQYMDGTRCAPIWNWYNRLPAVGQGLLAAVVLTIVLALGPQGVAPFIYFQF
ncbi:MAG: MBOAT family protein [Kiritimatiellaeota bacterium]|nr:MBOAT family protein [Kiritimatiellota bacterium]